MKTPSESDFSPLPELIAQFGLPNPLEVLPQLNNQLESVNTSSAHLTQVHAHLTELADHIDQSAGQVRWQGKAATGFDDRRADSTKSLRNTANVAQDVVHCHTESATTIWDLLVWITLLIAIVTLIIAALFAIALASSGWTFGSSLLLWLADATGLSMTVVTEIVATIGTVAWLLSSVFAEIRGKVTSSDIICPVPGTPPSTTPAPRTTPISTGSTDSPFPGTVTA